MLLSYIAFLLNNGKAYPIAHLVGLAEYFTWSRFWPSGSSWYMSTGWIFFGEHLKLPVFERLPVTHEDADDSAVEWMDGNSSSYGPRCSSVEVVGDGSCVEFVLA